MTKRSRSYTSRSPEALRRARSLIPVPSLLGLALVIVSALLMAMAGWAYRQLPAAGHDPNCGQDRGTSGSRRAA